MSRDRVRLLEAVPTGHPPRLPEGNIYGQGPSRLLDRHRPRVVHRLALENRTSASASVDLEDMILRLQTENDALAAVATESVDQAVARDGSLART